MCSDGASAAIICARLYFFLINIHGEGEVSAVSKWVHLTAEIVNLSTNKNIGTFKF
jgi:hypothetical protein